MLLYHRDSGLGEDRVNPSVFFLIGWMSSSLSSSLHRVVFDYISFFKTKTKKLEELPSHRLQVVVEIYDYFDNGTLLKFEYSKCVLSVEEVLS